MNVLYLMNVDWNWIKQRPHFIAEHLAKNNEIDILYQYRYSRRGFQKRDSSSINISPIYVIPKGDRNNSLKKINTLIIKNKVKQTINKKNPDCIYLTYPDQINKIPDVDIPLIYDCMDDHIAFIDDTSKKSDVLNHERILVKKAKIILCSSENLKSVLIRRYGNFIKDKTYIVRNGYDGSILNIQNGEVKRKKRFIISYIGTISHWFDFDLIEQSLEKYPNIEYKLIGPIAKASIPSHSRIKYLGTIEHSNLYDSIKNDDCLIMPFQLNDIIKSVDPVKLYEYINYNKNIISIKYKEIERFDKFVNFYNSVQEYNEILGRLLVDNRTKYSNDDRIRFLHKNNWESRVQQIEEIMLNEIGK